MVAVSLNNLGNLVLDAGEYDQARTLLEEAVAIRREVGDRWATANSLNNLGNVVRTQGDYEQARALYHESLIINREMGDKWALAYLLEDIGGLAALQGQADRALRLTGAAAALRETIGAPLSAVDSAQLDRLLAPARLAIDLETQHALEADGKAWPLERAIEYALSDQL
jgi:tetratricopeptide (TPR) repeat protein